jgi:peptide chain release factor 1
MKESIRQRLQQATDRFEEVGRMLSSEGLDGGSQQFRELSMEYARLQPLAEALQRYHGLERELTAARELEADGDPGMRALGSE